MANAPVRYPRYRLASSLTGSRCSSTPDNSASHFEDAVQRIRAVSLILLAAVVLSAPLLAQGPPRISSADPTSGKVDDMVTLTGEHLSKTTVTGVFLSDDKTDYKATIVDQADQKIVIKVPKVKAGQYNVSVQVANDIYIEPVHFTVQE